jgi:hypothetical protein
MGKYVERITCKNKQMWFMDISGQDERTILLAWAEAKQVLSTQRDGCLALIDATNTPMSVAILNKAREVAAIATGNPRICVAFVGMAGLTKSTAQLHARTTRVNAHFSDTVDEAKEWLIKEAEKHQIG